MRRRRDNDDTTNRPWPSCWCALLEDLDGHAADHPEHDDACAVGRAKRLVHGLGAHEVVRARVDAEDALVIVSVSVCHEGEKGETTLRKRNGWKEERPRLLAVAAAVVEVAADAGPSPVGST